MAPFYADDWLSIYAGDCRAVLAELPAESADCVVTSPPYWGLRDYGTATWTGGDPGHEHVGMELRTADTGGPKQQTKRGSIGVRSGDCACGATRADSQLGLEPTPELYVEHMVAVFAEVRRVLKPSGTCWLNLGDSYNNPSENVGQVGSTSKLMKPGRSAAETGSPQITTAKRVEGLKRKDLVGIPWRVAFALQADGWYLRSDIIWSKPNPMPESVTDRPTKSHEYLFLLTKSPRYYFDADAVRETAIHEGRIVKASDPATAKNGQKGTYGATAAGFTQHDTLVSGRNIRSVWNIATRPYPGAHFAVFPPELPERCIKAGSPEGGVVLDPFGGSGTTGMVANQLNRRAVLIDLNPEYLKQQMRRNAQVPLGLGMVTEGSNDVVPEPEVA